MKIARVTYGVHEGDRVKREYAYLVNDNVKVGDIVQPTVNHAVSGKLFATTGVIQTTNKPTSKGGKELISQLEQVGYNRSVAPELQGIVKDVGGVKMLIGLKKIATGVGTMAYVGTQPESKESRTFTYASTREREGGKFQKDDYVGKATKQENGAYGLSQDTPYNAQNAYVQKQREYNMQMAQKGNGTETFENLGD